MKCQLIDHSNTKISNTLITGSEWNPFTKKRNCNLTIFRNCISEEKKMLSPVFIQRGINLYKLQTALIKTLMTLFFSETGFLPASTKD